MKNLTVLLDLIKMKKTDLVYNNYFIFYKYHKINEFVKRSLGLKMNNLKEFTNKLELFYHDTAEIKPNNKEQIEDFKKGKGKVVLNTAYELYDKLLNICKNQYDTTKLLRKAFERSVSWNEYKTKLCTS